MSRGPIPNGLEVVSPGDIVPTAPNVHVTFDNFVHGPLTYTYKHMEYVKVWDNDRIWIGRTYKAIGDHYTVMIFKPNHKIVILHKTTRELCPF